MYTYLRLLAILFFCQSLIIGWPTLAMSEETTAHALSNLEALSLADAFLAEDKFAEAEKIYQALRSSPQKEIVIEALFKLGTLSAVQKNYTRAIQFYFEILNSHPELTRVRLELARTYFSDTDYENAEFHFRLAQGDKNLPSEVKENITRFLTAIYSQKNWDLVGTFGALPESNINKVSGNREECINTIYGTFCRRLPGKESGVGLRAGLHGNYYQRLSKNFSFRHTAGFSVVDHRMSSNDDNSIFLASGPRLMFNNGELSLQATYARRWAANDEYSIAPGLRLETTFDIGRNLSLDMGAAWEKNDYADNYINSLLHGDTTSVYTEARYVLTNKSFVSSGLNYIDENTRVNSYSNNMYGGSLGYFNEFPWGISLYLKASLNQVQYKDASLYITDSGDIKEKVRCDNIFSSMVRFSNRNWQYLGFSPAVSYIYTDRNSNINNYSYDNHRIEFSIRKIF